MHLSLDRSVAAIAAMAVVGAIVLLYALLVAPPKVFAEIWPNVTSLFE
jgi:hypothetical protein